MRILHVITSLNIGGAERLMTILLPELRNLGNEVELLVFDGIKTAFTETLEKEGIKIHSLDSRNVYDPRNIIKIQKFINKYDIIHTHNTACQLFVPLAKIITFGNRGKLITTEHNTTNRRRGKRWLKPVDKWMYGKYSKVICIAESTEANLISHVGKRAKTTVIHNGIKIPNTVKSSKDLEGKIIISMVAAFRPQKNQDTLVKTMTILPDRFSLRFVGDGERREEIEQLTKSLGVSEKIEFLGNRSNINDLLQESHINVLSSHWEGLSLSSLECMASGRPFIASDVQGLKEIVEGYGILFPDNDYKALAEEILRLIEDRMHYESVSKKCRKRAEEFDIQTTALKYNDIYKEIEKI